MSNLQFVYTENGQEKSSLDEHKRRNEIMELNKKLREEIEKIESKQNQLPHPLPTPKMPNSIFNPKGCDMSNDIELSFKNEELLIIHEILGNIDGHLLMHILKDSDIRNREDLTMLMTRIYNRIDRSLELDK